MAPDDFANSVAGGGAPLKARRRRPAGRCSARCSEAGDHDLFQVSLQAGVTYTISEIGQAGGGGGTLGDPFLQPLRDAGGNVLAQNDDIVAGSDPDSKIVFAASASGTYYIDAGSFVDGYAGSYRSDVSQTGADPGRADRAG